MISRRDFLQRSLIVLGTAFAVSQIEKFVGSIPDEKLPEYAALDDQHLYEHLSDGIQALKEYYQGPIADLLYQDNPFLALVKK